MCLEKVADLLLEISNIRNRFDTFLFQIVLTFLSFPTHGNSLKYTECKSVIVFLSVFQIVWAVSAMRSRKFGINVSYCFLANKIRRLMLLYSSFKYIWARHT